jgi:hypothetical protein
VTSDAVHHFLNCSGPLQLPRHSRSKSAEIWSASGIAKQQAIAPDQILSTTQSSQFALRLSMRSDAAHGGKKQSSVSKLTTTKNLLGLKDHVVSPTSTSHPGSLSFRIISPHGRHLGLLQILRFGGLRTWFDMACRSTKARLARVVTADC